MPSIDVIATTQPSRTPEHRPGDTPEKVRDAASQFEGLLIAQMLQSARESTAGSFGTDDHSSDTIMEMAEQQISTLLASSGGVGLSKLIIQGLAQPKPKEVSQATPEPQSTQYSTS